MGRCPAGARRGCGLFVLLAAGCMPLGYVYPKVSYIAPRTIGAPSDQVHAYRVDITNDDNNLAITEHDKYILTPLPLRSDGGIDAQTKIAVDYGCLMLCCANYYHVLTSHTLLVRLYRPGYQTVEIEAWQSDKRINWVKADTLEDQERAVDALVSTWKTTPEHVQVQASFSGFTPPLDPIVFYYLAPASVTPEHRQALCFAASEYQRLLSAAQKPELRARLQAKAKALSEMAAK